MLTNIRKHMYLIIILAVMLFHITFKVNIVIHQIANSSLQMYVNAQVSIGMTLKYNLVTLK